MKRKALLIGAPGKGTQELPGVKSDMKNYKNFLMSEIGGKWANNEIIILLGESKEKILKQTELIKKENNDFVFLVFSGHANYSTICNSRRLYIDNSEFVYETHIRKLSDKQLTIIDSCAESVSLITEKFSEVAGLESFHMELNDYRKVYDDYILNCPPQEIVLYSCSIDEFSVDTNKGGLYSYNLLNTAKNNHNKILTALQANEKASEVVRVISNGDQNPDYYDSRKSGNKLPFSIYLNNFV
ncbi:hypothetical protein GCM10023211_01880 [Orbus sasakiae]|uniref:Peptidase C14 caspase domain-containing protein n=1 Tax=Orbus sasakiae TaxID=1078475 RepID=A0ABP9N3U4_9GAMM